MEPFVIRRPAAAERRACAMLLPGAAKPGEKARLFVAAAGEPPRVVGAAALGVGGREGAQDGAHREWRVDVRVIVPFRRRGIARALVDHAASQARAHGVAELYAWEWVDPESEAARAWAALGFSPWRRKTEYEADLEVASRTLAPLLEEVRRSGWVPPGARIVPLSEADPEAVASLHVRHLGGSRRLLMPLLTGAAPDLYDPTHSRVLLLDGRVVGFTLGRVFEDRGYCEVDANVLDPAVRMGWANVWLKMEAAESLLAAGIRTIRYFTLDRHTDTRRVSVRVGGRPVRTLVRMRRDIGAGDGTVEAPTAPPSPAGSSGGGA
jgi:GNAT superfamily N-acetyltransferase